jgi:hypothetical protein
LCARSRVGTKRIAKLVGDIMQVFTGKTPERLPVHSTVESWIPQLDAVTLVQAFQALTENPSDLKVVAKDGTTKMGHKLGSVR